jgi:hypothetical protein
MSTAEPAARQQVHQFCNQKPPGRVAEPPAARWPRCAGSTRSWRCSRRRGSRSGTTRAAPWNSSLAWSWCARGQRGWVQAAERERVSDVGDYVSVPKAVMALPRHLVHRRLRFTSAIAGVTGREQSGPVRCDTQNRNLRRGVDRML